MASCSMNVNFWHTVSLQPGFINSSLSSLFSYLSLYEPAGWWRPCPLEELWHTHLHFWFCRVQSMRHALCREVTPGLCVCVCVCLCIMIHYVYSTFPGDSKADSMHGPKLPQAQDRLLTEIFNAYFTTEWSLSESSWIFYHAVFAGKWLNGILNVGWVGIVLSGRQKTLRRQV